MEICVAGPDDKYRIRDIEYNSLLADVQVGALATPIEGAHRVHHLHSSDRSSPSKQEFIFRGSDPASLKSAPPQSKTIIAKENKNVIGFCTVVRGSEQNSLAEIYIIPSFRGRKIGRRLWESARRFIDKNKDTTVALLGLNIPAKKFYEGLGFAETGVSWEGDRSKHGNGTTVIEMILRPEAKKPS